MQASHRADTSPPAGRSRNKRILFIGLSYYAYTGRIVGSLREKGFEVRYYPMENRGFWSKTIRRFLPSLYRPRLRHYHARIVEDEGRADYDYVFFLQIHTMAVDQVEKLRRKLPHAKFLLYNWDSVATHDYRPYLRFLDAAFTFDRSDAEMLGIQYLPLFALPEYFVSADRDRAGAPRHDIYFVGAIVTLERFAAIRRLDGYCRAHGLRFAKHLHCSPVTMAMLLRRGLYLRGMTLRSLSTRRIVEIMNRATAVFDFPNHRQSGYTMRLIENMCAGKRIVTSNPAVRRESFYTEQQFFVAESLDFEGLKEFLERGVPGTVDLNSGQHAEFALDRWLDRIFEGNNEIITAQDGMRGVPSKYRRVEDEIRLERLKP